MSGAPNLHHAEEGWIPHNGGDCPINRDAIVRFQFACGRLSEKEHRAGNFIWRHRGFPYDVVGYKVVSLPEEARG
jgi:hypothetical protein